MGQRGDMATGGSWWLSAMALAVTMVGAPAYAQRGPSGPVPAVASSKAVAVSPPVDVVTLDRVVAIVNSDLILESDVDAEQRFRPFQPFSEPKPESQEELIERLIDRTLILEQAALQPGPPVTDAEVDSELTTLRKSIPRCAAYHCETDQGWMKFVEEQGFTVDQVRERWRQRMEVLRFIEERFRSGISIPKSDIDDYYKTTMVPMYQKENATPQPEATLADRIQEILLQRRVDTLLDDWLTALRAEGSVRVLKPGEDAP